MYPILSEAHRGLAMLAPLLTAGWAAIVLISDPAQALGPGRRAVYLGAMISTGLVGVTGLVIVALGPYLTMIFPWLGLALVAAHGMAGARSRRAFMAGAKSRAVVAAGLAVLALLVAYGLMVAKPF